MTSLKVGGTLLALLASACMGGGSYCPKPKSTTEPATLHIVHLHEFDKSYEVFDVSYKLGDCMLFRNTNTSVLTQKEADLGSHVVASGAAQLTLITRFKSAFAADMHAYEWFRSDPFQLEIPANGKVELKVRYHEEWAEDPRQRMKLELFVNGNPLGPEQ